MEKVEGLLAGFVSGKPIAVHATFPEHTVIAEGDKCYVGEEGPVGVVTWVCAGERVDSEKVVCAKIDFPVGTRLHYGMKVSCCTDAELAIGELPCADAVGCLLRIGDRHFPARDIAEIRADTDGNETVHLAFRDGRPRIALFVANAQSVVRAWEIALNATA